MPTIQDLTSYITKEMRVNAQSSQARDIRQKNQSLLDTFKALTQWKSMVGNRRPWDHKGYIKNTYGEWALDAETETEFNFDIWSNIHYGYVGRSVGFSGWTLKAGAGYAQWAAGTSPKGYWSRRADTFGDADVIAAFDDPKDQAAIQIGIALWDSYKLNITSDLLLEALRLNRSSLQTR
ncbi:polymorphic toxin type 44 domain-containing protein [Neptunomonas phycophila]|uniref:polymorphic toxin type 44 domain-containing protein n=1 Tax=Neptunomonas phycophila TaxID=1572645 RepID=UPI001BED10FB|nr:polymorphic toxin type 44 domain-containing protein [Neptunomonas phycophila]MBT3145203.1 hypothetical protein [Neptunomonas phycophila]MDO6784849.1 polymorphic toxin type 44 domain-containing protein [Neptunomonas phycophila]